MKKRIAAALVLVLLLAGGAVAAVWYKNQTERKVIRGSPSVEFVTTQEPAQKKRPKKVVQRTPWPTYGFDAARSHVAGNFKHRPPFRRLWSVDTGEYIEFPPIVAYGRLYVQGQKGHLMAVDAKTGKVAWEREWGRCAAASPAAGKGLLYVAVMLPLPCPRGGNRLARRGFVVALNPATGKVRWRFDAGVVESSPLLVGNHLYVGSWDHHVYALDARTGKVRWSYDTGEEIDTSAAYAYGTIYIATNEGHVYALTAFTGKLRWRASSFSRFGRREYFYATPTVAYGRVYAGNTDGTVYAYGAKSGRLLWAQSAGSYVYSAPAVWRRTVYVGSYDGKMYALDAATGDVRWTYEAGAAIHGAPTVMGGLVYFAQCDICASSQATRYVKDGPRAVHAVSARTGKLVWKKPNVGLYSALVADSERVYVVGSTNVVAYAPKRR